MNANVCDKLSELKAHRKTASFKELDELFEMADFDRQDPARYPFFAVYTHARLGTQKWTLRCGDQQLSPGEVASAIEAIEDATSDECEHP